jgi:hypothetical protein
MRFRYSTSDPAQDEFDSLPRIPLVLTYNNQQLEMIGLVDSGATVSVLPYEVGLQLGAQWDNRKANLRLAGNLGKSASMPIFVIATIGDFAPVRLAFAWAKVANAPLILGQTNFFMEFDVHFYRSRLEFEIEPKS